MSWNYRVLRHPDGSLALHEVYYDKGKPVSYTLNLVCFGVDAHEGLEGLTAFLELALPDANERPILDISKIKPKAASPERYPRSSASADEPLPIGRRCASTLKGKPMGHDRMLYGASGINPESVSLGSVPRQRAKSKRNARRTAMKEPAFGDDDEENLIAAYERGEFKPIKDQKGAARQANIRDLLRTTAPAKRRHHSRYVLEPRRCHGSSKISINRLVPDRTTPRKSATAGTPPRPSPTITPSTLPTI